MKPNIISVGYGRHLFSAGNPERARMELCALEAGELHMIIFTNSSDNLEPQVLASGLHLHPTNSQNKPFMILDAIRIAQNIIKQGTEKYIVTTQDPFASGLVGYLLKLKLRVRWIVQEHGDVFGSPHWRKESLFNQISYRVGRFLLRRADIVRVVSDRVRTNMRALGIPESKLRQLSVAIDLSDFTQKTTFRSPADKQFQFLTVARLVPQKNFPLLLRAFHDAWQANPSLRLTIVGSGPEQSVIEKLIAELFPAADSPVTLQGWSNDVASLMRAADAYVLSSNYEGWARVLIEAMVTNLPIVTTDVGCATEVVKDEVHGLVVPVADVAALSTAMGMIASDHGLYAACVQNLQSIDPTAIPGTDVTQYGKRWVETLD